MTLKDWKKSYERKGEIIWTKKYLKISILHLSVRGHPWIVTNKEYDEPYLREFKSKSQALKFAKAYMRKH